MNLIYEHKTMDLFAMYGDDLAYCAHLHHHIEFVYMLEGESIGIVDSNEYKIKTDNAFIVFPNQIHQYKFASQEKYIILIFPPEMCVELLDTFRKNLPSCPIVNCENIKDQVLYILNQIIKVNKDNDKYKNIITNGYLSALMGTLFNLMTFEQRKLDNNLIKNILNYCSNNYMNNICLDTLAKAMHVNKCYVSQLFNKKLKISFNDYINMLRISEACVLLEKNEESITNIAYSVGFNSPRSFNRAFLKYASVTPREYQKKIYME